MLPPPPIAVLISSTDEFGQSSVFFNSYLNNKILPSKHANPYRKSCFFVIREQESTMEKMNRIVHMIISGGYLWKIKNI